MYQAMYYSGIAGSVIFFFLTVIMFFKNNIFQIICDLMGITARKNLKQLKANGGKEKSSKKGRAAARSGKIVVRSGDATERLTEEIKKEDILEETTVLIENQNVAEYFFQIDTDIVVVHSEETINN